MPESLQCCIDYDIILSSMTVLQEHVTVFGIAEFNRK